MLSDTFGIYLLCIVGLGAGIVDTLGLLMYDKVRLSLGAKVWEEIAACTSESKEEVNQRINQPTKQTFNHKINRRETFACRSWSRPVLCYSIVASSCVVLQHCWIVLCCVTALLHRPVLCYSFDDSSCVVLQHCCIVLCCYSIVASSCVVLQHCCIVLCCVTALMIRPVSCYRNVVSSCVVLQHCCIVLCCVTALLNRPVFCYRIAASSCVVLQLCCIVLRCVTALLHLPVLCYSFAASSCVVLQHWCIVLCCVTVLLHKKPIPKICKPTIPTHDAT